MMRVGFSTNDHREYFDGAGAIEDPTPYVDDARRSRTSTADRCMTPTSGSGKSTIYMVLPKYSVHRERRLPGEVGHQPRDELRDRARDSRRRSSGCRTPRRRGRDRAAGRTVLVVSDVGDYRLPTVHSFDGRVSKAFNYQQLNANFDFDVFNLFNPAPILGRGYDLRPTRSTRCSRS